MKKSRNPDLELALDALGTMFALGHDFFSDAKALGFETKTDKDKRKLWKQYGARFLIDFDPDRFDIRPDDKGERAPRFLTMYGLP